MKGILLGIAIMATVILVFAEFTAYSGTAYEIDQSKEWLWRARATNDLNDMANYLTKAEQLLMNKHGNPAWFYPKPDTDLDLIRTNIHEVIGNCKTFANTTDTMAYQQAVHNLQETIIEITDHLEATVGWTWCWSPGMILGEFIVIFLWVLTVLFYLVEE